MVTTPLIMILLGLTVVVIGFFFSHAASSSWVSHHANQAKASASALNLFSYYAGGSIGSSLLGFIWEPFGWTGVISVTVLLVIIGMWNAFKMNQLEKENVVLRESKI